MANAASKSIERKLRQAWKQERRFINLRGISRFVIWLIVLLAVDFIIDWGILFRSRTPANLGPLLLGINIVVLAWVLWREWLRHLKPYDPLLVALEVERRHPELSSLLVSYTQLDDIQQNQPNVSADLVQAMQENAVIRTKPIDFREIVNFGQLTRLLSVAGGILLVFTVLSVSWPEHMRILMERLAGDSEEYPTQTHIVSVEGAKTIRVGDSVTISAVVEDVIPEQGTIYIKPAEGNGNWTSLPLLPSAKRKPGEDPPPFERVLEELTEDQLFYVRIGDDQWDVQRIRVVPAPRIERVAVALVYQ